MSWLRVAAEYCQESCDKVRAELRKAKDYHDHVLLSHGLGHTVTQDTPDGLPEVPVFTFLQPLDSSRTSQRYERSVRKYEAERRLVVPGRNIKDLETPTEKKYLSTTFHRMWYYAHNMTKHLCSHSKAEPSRHHSHHLHYGQPYLRLGPFKGSLIYFSSVNLYIDRFPLQW